MNYPKDKESNKYLVKVTHNVTELMKSITIEVNLLIPNTTNERKIKFEKDSEIEKHVKGKYSKTFGQCFILEVPLWIQNLKVTSEQWAILNNKKTWILLLFIMA